MRTYITTLMLLATLALMSCGGGNDVASSSASAVSAAAPVTTTTATAPSTPATTATEPKVNGQVDERTGVAPVVAAMTAWSPTSNGGCLRSRDINWFNDGPAITRAQRDACGVAMRNATDTENEKECRALGGGWQPTTWYCSGINTTNSQQCSAWGGYMFSVIAFCYAQ